jgi:23S rRNA (uridine2552-2'-O)-methyltransferase
VGVDIDRVAPLPPARFVRGDMTAPETLQKVRTQVTLMRGGGPPTLDAVISDMSPNISGVYSVDQARSLMLAKKALETARVLLRPGGRFVAKAFEGEDFGWLLKQIEASFAFVKVHSPPASRKASSEVYIVAKGFKRARGKKQIAREEE